MTVRQLQVRLQIADGIDRLHLLNTLAQHLMHSDRPLACHTAFDAYTLSCELEPLYARDTIISARVLSLFLVDFCSERSDTDTTLMGEAHRLLGELPASLRARVLLKIGQMYQAAGEYRQAMRCFYQADLVLGGGSVPQTFISSCYN